MYTVRTAASAGGASRDSHFDTKRLALEYIRSLGKLSYIRKTAPRLYVVVPSGRR